LVLRSLLQVALVAALGPAVVVGVVVALGAVAVGTTPVGAAADVVPGFRRLRRLRGPAVAAAVGVELAGVAVAGTMVVGVAVVGSLQIKR
jgi:hypothetical protein